MFKKGEYIIYGSSGVCKVMDISTVDMNGVPNDKLYYSLEPFNMQGGKIFTPVDTTKTIMRKILTKEEANALIDTIPDIQESWADNDKAREVQYKAAIKSCDCREWIKIIKSLYQRKQERLAQGRKITMVEDKYLKMAESCLHTELSIPLGIPVEEMEGFIADRIAMLK